MVAAAGRCRSYGRCLPRVSPQALESVEAGLCDALQKVRNRTAEAGVRYKTDKSVGTDVDVDAVRLSKNGVAGENIK